MSFYDRLKRYLKILKTVTICGSGILIVTYHYKRTLKRIDKIVNTNVLDSEKKLSAEYIYIDDPTYNATIKEEHFKEVQQTVGLARIWKSFKYSLVSRLLWLCRHGNKEQRAIALDQLAMIKNNKTWDCLKVAQTLDKTTAVLLARTRGADLRYFLPPPIHVRRAALTSELLSFKFRDMISSVQAINPHSCIHYFLNKYFVNLLDHIEVDSIPAKPDSVNERDLCLLCLEALYHHVSLFNQKNYSEDLSASMLIKLGVLPRLSEALLRYRNDVDMDMAVLRILTVLSIHKNLLRDFFENGLIGELSRLLHSEDIRLSSSAAVCLVNLSGENCYRPGVYLLHPIYRSRSVATCDTLLVHGLRGGVFVTWRQRDKSSKLPVSIMDATVSDNDCEAIIKRPPENKYLDPDLQQVIQDMLELDDETLLSSVEVVMQDIPLVARREPKNSQYTAQKKRMSLLQEEYDKCNYTQCWPKDWLPKDCDNLRILGVNYWSTLSDWLERCPLHNADIKARADELSTKLYDADVGKRNIVWLTHSMGGLITKKILVDIAENENSPYRTLCENTRAVIFYSTPHKGSALATMPRAAAAILWPSQDVKQLQENSPMLLELHNSFIDCADLFKWETVSFGESLPTLVTAFKVPIHFVDSQSADLGRGVFYKLPLDHLSICKPATRQSILYTAVLDIIQRISLERSLQKQINPFWLKLIEFYSLIIGTKVSPTVKLVDKYNSENNIQLEKILIDSFNHDFLT